ncbi:ATP-binding protein [Caldalkalibacillus salinus]|uniref:ATP-binding protein n=1 Tax=Caldalkalibacillus salinus TaxID=2803787 RepID=UPI001F43C75D|nr:sensor histidine kinase [Caldalkalibacillus salinus]
MKISIRVKMLILSFCIVLISILTSGLIMIYSISAAFEKELGERATAIARTVAQLPEVRNHVGQPEGETIIQPIAERIRLATNVDYIVIIDMDRIRYSHPSESYLGTRFEGGDERAALSEHEYRSKAHGPLGYAVRAFVPVMDDDGTEQVGVAVVGILTPTFQSLLMQYQNDLLLSLVWGLLVGLIGSWVLGDNIKKETFNMEPYEIARLVEERSAVIQAMDMGIIAVDSEGHVTFMNQLAKSYTGYHDREDVTLHIKTLFPESDQSIVQTLGRQVTNRTLMVQGNVYLLSTYPIKVKEALVGSLITMQDRTQANRLAEELTGVKTLVDALRAQNHEYMNKLHSIAGLIQLERTEEALDIIIEKTTDEEDVVQFLKNNIKIDSLSGLLLGKRSRAKEIDVYFVIDQDSHVQGMIPGFQTGDLVTIVGNLIENAFESFSNAQAHKKVSCLIQGDERALLIQVSDNGQGIAEQEQQNMFQYGYSTKQKEGRGIGLALVKEIVEAHQGLIDVNSIPHQGTTMTIKIKSQGEEQYNI